MLIRACVDEPVAGALTYRHSVTVRGFAFSSSPEQAIAKITVLANGATLGSSTSFFNRPDVEAAFPDQPARLSGFEILCALDPDPGDDGLDLDVVATLSDGTEQHIGNVPLRLAQTDYRNVDYGRLIDRSGVDRWTRENIYGSGPPSPTPSLGCLALLRRYIPPGETVLDVGCGVGAYAEGLIAHGVDWTGCDAAPLLCEHVAARGLHCKRVEGSRLPFADRSFDRSICIEVLEHVAQPEDFVAEIARVTKDEAYFSVPNAELIPLMRPLGAVPWHLLELDHKNFFSRYSLEHVLRRAFARVEIVQYAPLSIKSIEGLPLACHLFAIASGPIAAGGAHERIA